jgi:hypothetical protein
MEQRKRSRWRRGFFDKTTKTVSHLAADLNRPGFAGFRTKANAATYHYISRLVPDGPKLTGLQVDPLEPISARVWATATFRSHAPTV